MIITRLASAIRHQNWSQIITEILIVVIGIFLGLQVTDWNEERKDAIAARAYTEQLLIDINLAIDITDVQIDRYQSRIALIDELFKVLRGKKPDRH